MKPQLEEILKVVESTYSRNLRSVERTMDLNFLRQAFTNAVRPYYTTTELGYVLGRNHATIVHYAKGHMGLMRDTYYRDAFHRVQVIYSDFESEQISIRPMDVLRSEVIELKTRLQDLELQIKKHGEPNLQPDLV